MFGRLASFGKKAPKELPPNAKLNAREELVSPQGDKEASDMADTLFSVPQSGYVTAAVSDEKESSSDGRQQQSAVTHIPEAAAEAETAAQGSSEANLLKYKIEVLVNLLAVKDQELISTQKKVEALKWTLSSRSAAGGAPLLPVSPASTHDLDEVRIELSVTLNKMAKEFQGNSIALLEELAEDKTNAVPAALPRDVFVRAVKKAFGKMSQRECGFIALRFAELGSNSVNVAEFLTFFSLPLQQRHAMQARALVRTSRDAFELVNSAPSSVTPSIQKSAPPNPDMAPLTDATVAPKPVLTKPDLVPAAAVTAAVKPAETVKEDNVDKSYDAEDEEEEEVDDDRLFAAAARQMVLQKETAKAAESASPTKAVSEINAFEPIESPVKPSKPVPAPAPALVPATAPAPSPLKSNVIPKPAKPSPEKSVSDVGVFDLEDSYFDDD